MEIEAITQMVNTMGFPIACVVALFMRMTKQDEMHKQEIDKLSEALQNNTLVMTKLCDKLGVDE